MTRKQSYGENSVRFLEVTVELERYFELLQTLLLLNRSLYFCVSLCTYARHSH